MVGLYLLGILMAVVMALIMKKSVFTGEAVPFVMELPDYRMPSPINVVRLLWEKAKDFITRAFSVILIATLAVWFLQRFDIHMNLVDSSSDSIMALLAGLFVPLFRPLGLGDWRIVTSLICGFMAKESVVATLEVSFGASVRSVLNTVSAAAMLVFSLLYTPCVAAVAAIRRELGNKWALGVVLWQCLIAWLMAFLVKVLLGGF
jgi:ferrous iron transport protein B